MKSDRVVVTGRGTVNAIAKNVIEFTTTLRAGTCGIGPVTLFDTTDYRTHTGAQVNHFDARLHIPKTYSFSCASSADHTATHLKLMGPQTTFW
ncbi:MAG: hypothetical protein KFF68_16170 [Desulfosarcina sp.]|nr:hypothetical protein [Desulfosarcina sp.]